MPFADVFASGVPEERKRLICAQSVAVLSECPGHPPRHRCSRRPRMISQSGSPARRIGVVIDNAEGSWGALCRPVRFPEITDYVMTGAHAPASNQPMLQNDRSRRHPKCP
jgi:hypothetical protein